MAGEWAVVMGKRQERKATRVAKSIQTPTVRFGRARRRALIALWLGLLVTLRGGAAWVSFGISTYFIFDYENRDYVQGYRVLNG